MNAVDVKPILPDPTPGPPEWFAGDVQLMLLAVGEPPARVQVARVAFAAGARTAWHVHPLGQVLHILEGTAQVRRDGGTVVDVAAGGTVWFAPGERHWHGAGPAGPMVHLAIQEAGPDGRATTWAEHVSDPEG